jgi:hypothetical protein
MRTRTLLLAVALVSVTLLSSCGLREYNWWRTQAGIEKIRATDPDAQWHLDAATDIWRRKVAAYRQATTTVRLPPILWRIAACESGNGQAGINYQARNPSSSAAGGWQFLSSTWRTVTVSYPGTWDRYQFGHLRREAASVPSMAHAQPRVQQAAALVLYHHQGTRPWDASRHCWG